MDELETEAVPDELGKREGEAAGVSLVEGEWRGEGEPEREGDALPVPEAELLREEDGEAERAAVGDGVVLAPGLEEADIET